MVQKKSKAMTYLLIFAVMLVWGFILYKVVSAMSGNDDVSFVPAKAIKKQAYNDYGPTRDTSRLLGNYRDPFGLAPTRDTTKITAVKTVSGKIRSAPRAPGINWNLISYTGYIRNSGSKKLLALLHINGTQKLMSEGETVEQVKLLRNLRDSVKISYRGQTRFIPIKPVN